MKTDFDPNLIFPESGDWIELEISHHCRLIQSLPNWLEILESTHKAKIFGGHLEKRSVLFDDRHVTTKTTHLGLDFWMPEETSVHSPVCGKVILAEPDNQEPGGWGGRIDLQSADGIIHTFAHLQTPAVAPGDTIATGSLLGKLAPREENGGWKPHLHYQCTTPEEYARFQPASLMDAYAEPLPDLPSRYPAPGKSIGKNPKFTP